MPERNDRVGADHEFHDREYVQGWADRFTATPGRLQLFEEMAAALVGRTRSQGRIVELGLGPGFLAEFLLERFPEVDYVGLDFSAPMIEIARRRLSAHDSRMSYVQADLVREDWAAKIPGSTDAIVSTWALHDLGSQENVQHVYEQCRYVLGQGGILLNGDFIKPAGTQHPFEGGRFEVRRPLEMLLEAGFSRADCITPVIEEEIESPSSTQNYVCMRGLLGS